MHGAFSTAQSPPDDVCLPAVQCSSRAVRPWLLGWHNCLQTSGETIRAEGMNIFMFSVRKEL